MEIDNRLKVSRCGLILWVMIKSLVYPSVCSHICGLPRPTTKRTEPMLEDCRGYLAALGLWLFAKRHWKSYPKCSSGRCLPRLNTLGCQFDRHYRRVEGVGTKSQAYEKALHKRPFYRSYWTGRREHCRLQRYLDHHTPEGDWPLWSPTPYMIHDLE